MRIHKRLPYPSEQTILASEPELGVVDRLVLEAYGQLGTERSFGMIVGPIPYRAILAWVEFEQIDRDNAETIIKAIIRLEAARSEREASERNLRET